MYESVIILTKIVFELGLDERRKVEPEAHGVRRADVATRKFLAACVC